MPQVYKRKTNRSTRDPFDVLERAAASVKDGTSIRQAAAAFDIDKMTLSRFIHKRKSQEQPLVGYAAVTLNNFVIPPAMELDLAQHIKMLGDMFHGLSLQKCKELAYEFAIQNNLKVPVSWNEKKRAGKSWWLGFKSRQKLSIRSPEATSAGRASAFNKFTVNEYFDNLAKVLDDNKFKAEQIFNVDETAVTTVQNPGKVVTAKGAKRVGSVTSAKRGELVTVVYTICASGSVLPPMLIFPRVHYRDHFIRGGPQGCVGKCSRTGWINEELFLEYIDFLVGHTRCSPTQKILLTLDNHEAHISLRVIDRAKSSGIVLLTIPPKTSHRLQALDVTVFSPFKTMYYRTMDNWMRSNLGKTVTIYDIPAFVKEAQLSAMVPRNICRVSKALEHGSTIVTFFLKKHLHLLL